MSTTRATREGDKFVATTASLAKGSGIPRALYRKVNRAFGLSNKAKLINALAASKKRGRA